MVNLERFHVSPASAVGPVMQGWWAERPTAERKLTTWVGSHDRPDARITLVDEEAGETLTAWPEEP